MDRKSIIQKIEETPEWDIIIIGGGATGLGSAVDAATRGFKTLLLEQSDFSKSTSSRSTKLVHGGVRYLAQGDVAMVREALRERGRMKRNCPHLVRDMRFIIGNYRWWEQPYYTIGLTCYDMLAWGLSYGRSLPMSKSKVLKEIPGMVKEGLKGGVVYHDGQFDDSRMAITLALTAQDKGATVANYIEVKSLIKDSGGKICGVKAKDSLGDGEFEIKGKVVINATGVFVDDIMKMDAPETRKKVRPSQGVHLVVDLDFLGGDSALMIPKTKDGRVLFGVPWHGKAVLGTTDTPLDESSLEPRALEEEVNFILDQAGQYLTRKPERKDVLAVYAGLRPLAAPQKESDKKKTKEISRSHKIYESESGLLTITGGKWTTYRVMAEEIVDRAIKTAGLDKRSCTTQNMRLHGWKENVDRSKWDYVYGSDDVELKKIIDEDPKNGEFLLEGFTFTPAHVIFAVRSEFAQKLEDVLARRMRALFLDARKAIEIAPKVAEIMAKELGKDENWQASEVKEFTELANGYILK